MIKRSSVLFVMMALVVCVTVRPRAAWGQGNTWSGASLAQVVEDARWRFGSLRANAMFELADVGYNSDVYFGYRPGTTPDLTCYIGVPIQLLWPIGRNIVVDVFDKPQYQFFLGTPNERALNNTFSGQVHFAFDRIYIRAGVNFDKLHQSLSRELDFYVHQKSNELNGLVLWQASKAVSLAVLYKGARFDIGNVVYGGVNLAEALNRKENLIDFLTYVQPSSRFRFHVDGQYGNHVFTEARPNFRDTRTYAVFGGLDFLPNVSDRRAVAGLEGGFSLGYKRFDIIDPSFRDDSGFAGNADLSMGILKKTTGRIFFSRDFQYSVLPGATHYISLRYGGGIMRRLTRKVSASYDLSIGFTQYPQLDTGEGGVQPLGSNKFVNHMLGVDIQLARDLRILFRASAESRAVETTGLTARRGFIGLNLTYGAARRTVSTPLGGLVQ